MKSKSTVTAPTEVIASPMVKMEDHPVLEVAHEMQKREATELTETGRLALAQEHVKFREEVDETNDMIRKGAMVYRGEHFDLDDSEGQRAIDLNQDDNFVQAGEL